MDRYPGASTRLLTDDERAISSEESRTPLVVEPKAPSGAGVWPVPTTLADVPTAGERAAAAMTTHKAAAQKR